MTRIRLRIDFKATRDIGHHGSAATAAQAKKTYRQRRPPQGNR